MTSRKLTIGLLAIAAALPSAANAMPDQGYQGLRSPDAEDAAAQVQEQNSQGLRSPDAQDAADVNTRSVPATSVATVAQPAGDGFDWGDAGIGASIMLGLLAVASGTFLVVTSHRGRHARMG